MRVSSARWRPNNGEILRFGRVWGTRDSALGAGEVTPVLVASWLPEGKDDLKDVGDLVLEVVEAGLEEVEGLAQLLRPVFGKTSTEVAEFVAMADPISSYSQFTVADGEIDDAATIHFRSINWIAFTGAAEPGAQTLVVRSLRIVSRDSAVVFGWRPAHGYPRAPGTFEPDFDALNERLPGTIVSQDPATEARQRGDPDWLVAFAHGVGNDGPSRIPQLLHEWEVAAAPAGVFAETLLHQCVYAAHKVVTGDLVTALDRW